MNTCEWCGRKWNDGPIYNILVGTNTARAKTVCSEKCKKDIIEEKGEPTIEAKNEWGRKTKERRLEKEAAKNAKEEENKRIKWIKKEAEEIARKSFKAKHIFICLIVGTSGLFIAAEINKFLGCIIMIGLCGYILSFEAKAQTKASLNHKDKSIRDIEDFLKKYED